MKKIVFIDSEIDPENGQILDLGAVTSDGRQLHAAVKSELSELVALYEYIGGHNIIAHDLKYLADLVGGGKKYIDTLCLSPLLFPTKPYHRLLKDDKLRTDSLNNPLNDSIKSMELFFDEINAFEALNEDIKNIYCALLHDQPQFSGFFEYLEHTADVEIEALIKRIFKGRICDNVSLGYIIDHSPVELAYCLAIIYADDRRSVTPPWVYKNYPVVENYMRLLRNEPCDEGCEYCARKLDVKVRLKEIFGYEEFRSYNGEPLQEMAADAAVHNRSLLAVFPTGGGKSITFQLPALIAGETAKGLTVVISPLQSLMKDQVDNLAEMGIADAVTINGLLSPIERAEACERVASGLATLLYISPESLRSKTIENLLLSRNVVRFVIDEAHCFSAWGQDFRVDYLYIGDFIRQLQEKKSIDHPIPVSCFTATAKQKVISDIRDYFKQKLDIDLELYATDAARTNLRYEILYRDSDDEKYSTLRELIEQKKCPTIVYVSRTKRTFQIAAKLTDDGFAARPFNGKMDSSDKIANQEAFINGEVQIIVATSAFGMGVDKKDVGLVVHYDISDSLENYVQEAGRAGRDQSIQAECYVLFNEGDLDKHFILLNQTKLSQSEIQQIWRAIKDLTRSRPFFCRSALEIARQAGWDDSVRESETRVRTAIAALENAGYIKRGQNVTRVYADSILAHDMSEASAKIRASGRLNEQQKKNAILIIQRLISSRSLSKASRDEAESRTDYLADVLGIEKEQVIEAVELMREDGLLADDKDQTAYIKRNDTENRSLQILQRFSALERFLISILSIERMTVNLKELNDHAEKAGVKRSSVKAIKTILFYWTIRGYIEKTHTASDKAVDIILRTDKESLNEKLEKRLELAQFIVKYLFSKSADRLSEGKEETLVQFSMLELEKAYEEELSLFASSRTADYYEVRDALYYLSKIEALELEGGFSVSYNAMKISRLETDNRIQYKNEDYRQLNEFYKQKIQQIHIVGEYANMMVKDYDEALQFVNDYFRMDYKLFLAKYFKGNRLGEINRNITPKKYKQLFDCLSEVQREIIDDSISKNIVVAAGPGSGKTRVLVHKLAALLLLEDVKHEQLLMLTFSRAAATEFKSRLIGLIGNAASFVEIKTFHSYCFDLLGKIGSLEDSADIVRRAAEMIRSGEVELGRITKTVVVIDEAQDMDENEFALVLALMERNDDMKIIAVGDDDQNIYEFRGSDSRYLRSFMEDNDAKKYDLLQNYRSKKSIVEFSNRFARTISVRLKTEPIEAVSTDEGVVRIIKHKSRNLEFPIVRDLMSNKGEGTACVLTGTNDEALRVTGLLKKQGVPARLIQSNEGFSLYDLAEIRMFMKLVSRQTETPVISNEVWAAAVMMLGELYSESSCLGACMALLDRFASVNERKYRSDLEGFIRESQLSDFCEADCGSVVVSTIHRSKGREFDRVYMLLNNVVPSSDEIRRRLYVGMTRAKSELYIYCNNDAFDRFTDNISTDNIKYPEPPELMLQLTHKDVYLSYFEDPEIKSAVLAHRSGDVLYLKNKGLYDEPACNGSAVAVLSSSAKERLDKLGQKGYRVYKAEIGFIVAWHGENNDQENAVILPNIYLKKE